MVPSPMADTTRWIKRAAAASLGAAIGLSATGLVARTPTKPQEARSEEPTPTEPLAIQEAPTVFLAPVEPVPVPVSTLVTVEQASQLIAEHEGQRLTAYRDSEGVRTIGVGFNLEAPGHRAMLQEMGIDPRQMTQTDSTRLFRRKVEESLAACGRLFQDFGDLPRPVQLALVDMAYNLGATGLSQFRQLRAAVARRDWERAAGELMKSRWRHQVGWRAERLAGMIRECSTSEKG